MNIFVAFRLLKWFTSNWLELLCEKKKTIHTENDFLISGLLILCAIAD